MSLHTGSRLAAKGEILYAFHIKDGGSLGIGDGHSRRGRRLPVLWWFECESEPDETRRCRQSSEVQSGSKFAESYVIDMHLTNSRELS
jgi:hypothetical protein